MSNRPAPIIALPASADRAGSAIRTVGRRLLGWWRAASHRRAVRDLLELDDRALRDIGLTRNDVTAALAAPVMRDPSRLLTVRSVDRRSRLRLIVTSNPDPKRLTLQDAPPEKAQV